MQAAPFAGEGPNSCLLPRARCDGAYGLALASWWARLVRERLHVDRFRRVEHEHIQRRSLAQLRSILALDGVTGSRESDDELAALHPEVEYAELRERVHVAPDVQPALVRVECAESSGPVLVLADGSALGRAVGEDLGNESREVLDRCYG